MTTFLAICALVSGILAVVAEVNVRRRMLYVFKPLTMIFIVAILLVSPQATGAHQPVYRWLVGCALLCSICGDVFLMLEGDRFVAGVASFLVAHLFYIGAFVYGLAVSPARIAVLPTALTVIAIVAYAAVVMSRLWPRLGDMRVPVGIYVGVISTMLLVASCAWLSGAGPYAAAACAGAVLFVASDTTLAFFKFAGLPMRAHIFILGAYFLAQALICTSAVT